MIVLFPTYARQAAGGRCWRITVAGMAIRPLPRTSRRRAMAVAVLKRVMGLDDEQCAAPVFQQRSASFLFQRLVGRHVRCGVGGLQFTAGQTDRIGHFATTIDIDADRITGLGDRTPGTWLPTSAWLDDDDDAEPEAGDAAGAGIASGIVHLVPERGASVISDIDDTVKLSNVANRRELLANTFLREFVAVPGIGPIYRQWEEEGVAFHYVSSSPWQLADSLSGFFRDVGLPSGSLHLKLFRLKDSTPLGWLPSRKRSKRRAIERILADFPARRFLLVGDSGERDPEVYAQVARRHPGRIAGVMIRRVEGPRPATEKRFARLERRLPAGLVRVFTDAEELATPPAHRAPAAPVVPGAGPW